MVRVAQIFHIGVVILDQHFGEAAEFMEEIALGGGEGGVHDREIAFCLILCELVSISDFWLQV